MFGPFGFRSESSMKVLDCAVQVNAEVTSIPYGKASCRKGFQNFTELYVRTLHTSLTLFFVRGYEENLHGLQRRSMANTRLNSIGITPIQDMNLVLLY